MLIIGCGYVGQRLAQVSDQQVEAYTRSVERANALSKSGVSAHSLDLDRESMAPGSTAGEQIYYFAPPPPKGKTDTRMQRFIDAFPVSGQPQRIVYISTTGVYGDCHGDWVDENRPVNPMVDRAYRRWHAEQLLRGWQQATAGELVVLRVAGIYGPDKLPLERLRQGVPMVAEQDAPWTNRIHVDDLVQVSIAAMERGGEGEIYNVSDGHPGNMTDYFNRVADRYDLPRPPVISLEQAQRELSPGLLSYLGESRRLDNRKLLRDLDINLKYPTLLDGLAAV